MQAPASDTDLVNLQRIATPKERLLRFRLGTIDSTVLAEAQRNRFDDAPVVDENDRFVGIIPVSRVEALSASGLPIDSRDPEIYVHPLRDREPLLKFLDEIATHRAAVIHDTEKVHELDWFAMVTVSDLNRHAFRAYLYPLVAELESNIADFIDASFPVLGDWLPCIPDERRAEIMSLWEEAKLHGVDTSPVVYCNLTDLINIVKKHPALLSALGFESGRSWKEATGFLAVFRNQVMHPVRPLILAPEDAHVLKQRVEALLSLIETVKKENARLALHGAVMQRYMP